MTDHFLHAHPPVARALATDPGAGGPGAAARAGAALRALTACPALAASWDAGPVLALVTHPDPAARWAAAAVAGAACGLDDGAAASLAAAADPDPASRLAASLAWEAEAGAAAAERAAAWLVSAEGDGDGGTDADTPPPPPGHADVEGVWLPRSPHADATPRPPSTFVRTPAASSALRAAALALADARPLLLAGPPGAGKSALAAELAAAAGAAGSALVLHAGEAADARGLLGAYVGAGEPGAFRWAPGPLALAVTGGRWFVLEGAHAAPADALAALAPLLDGGPLPVPARGAALTPAPGFRLIATATEGAGPAVAGRGGVLESGGWARVGVPAPGRDDAGAVLAASLPPALAADLAPGGLDCLAIARAVEGLDEPSDAAAAALAAAGLARGGARSGRHPSLRDAVRWAARVAARCPPGAAPAGATPGPGRLPASLRELAAAEAADVFCSALADPAARAAAATAHASVWGLPPSWAHAWAHTASPDVCVGDAAVVVGRATLAVAPRSRGALRAARAGAARAAGGTATFTTTGAARRALESIAASLSVSEPVLLVGETGAGKTSAAQWLAAQAGARLEVVNLSQASDAADLLGGFRPVAGGGEVAALLADLAPLVAATWTRGDNGAFMAAATAAAAKGRWPRVVAACRAALKKVGGGEGVGARSISRP